MAAKRVVLVTGVSRDLGARFARSLAAEGHVEVVGIDVIPPRHDLGAADFVRADIRNPVISKVIATRGCRHCRASCHRGCSRRCLAAAPR
jgi:UDP-glucose 4-epimerase